MTLVQFSDDCQDELVEPGLLNTPFDIPLAERVFSN